MVACSTGMARNSKKGSFMLIEARVLLWYVKIQFVFHSNNYKTRKEIKNHFVI